MQVKKKKMEIRKINKKGDIENLFYFIVTMLGLALFIIILAYVVPKVTDEMKKTDMNESSYVRDMFSESDAIIDRLDPVYLIVFAGLIIAILITSFFINSHPIFIPIYIFLLGFVVVVGVIANHVYDEFAANTDLATAAASQTFMISIMDNFVLILIGVGILSMIIIFAKPFQARRI